VTLWKEKHASFKDTQVSCNKSVLLVWSYRYTKHISHRSHWESHM